MEQGHDRRFALCKGGMDFFIGRHVKIHGKEHKLHGPCCATFWDLSSYVYFIGNWAECSTESASIIECWVQDSIINHDRFPDELVLRVHCTLEMEIEAMGGTSSCLRREYAVSICSKLLGRASRDGFPVGKQEALVRHGNPFVA